IPWRRRPPAEGCLQPLPCPASARERKPDLVGPPEAAFSPPTASARRSRIPAPAPHRRPAGTVAAYSWSFEAPDGQVLRTLRQRFSFALILVAAVCTLILLGVHLLARGALFHYLEREHMERVLHLQAS